MFESCLRRTVVNLVTAFMVKAFHVIPAEDRDEEDYGQQKDLGRTHILKKEQWSGGGEGWR